MSAVTTEDNKTSAQKKPFDGYFESVVKDIYGISGLLGLGHLAIEKSTYFSGSAGLITNMIGVTVCIAGSNLMCLLLWQSKIPPHQT